MIIDTEKMNPAFTELIRDPNQIIFLDANFFISPDRGRENVKQFPADQFKENWLEPLFLEFSSLSIHESVYDELVEEKVKAFADEKINGDPEELKVYYDTNLTPFEQALMNHYISRISIYSYYDPIMDGKKDRGEVRSLSYMAVKGFLYFAANDALPIRLINEAETLNTGLDDMGIIQMYELLYFLHKKGRYNDKALRALYKYQYYLYPAEKKKNPGWGDFIQKMDELYSGII